MKINFDHLKKRRKITLYVSEENQELIRKIAEKFPDVPFSKLVFSALREKFGTSNIDSLFGVFHKYSKKEVSRRAEIEETLNWVAENAAKEGISD